MDNKIVVKMIFGSQLYGTETPDSDTDYKGVFLPTKDELLLNRVPKHINQSTGNDFSKNTKDDIDIELFSIYEFIKLACEGQTVALDMLHAPANMLIETSDLWNEIVNNREKFYTRNLKAFIGYARRQAAKYGVKGSRLDAAKEVKERIERTTRRGIAVRLEDIWDKLPVNEYCHPVDDSPQGVKQYNVCGRILQARESLASALVPVNKFCEAYGSRAKMAADNQGIDWKAVSHAIRAAYQVEELLIEGTITFPLKQASYLKNVKQGKYDYMTEVGPHLDEMMERADKLSIESTLPDKPDVRFWDNFIKEAIQTYVL